MMRGESNLMTQYFILDVIKKVDHPPPPNFLFNFFFLGGGIIFSLCSKTAGALNPSGPPSTLCNVIYPGLKQWTNKRQTPPPLSIINSFHSKGWVSVLEKVFWEKLLPIFIPTEKNNIRFPIPMMNWRNTFYNCRVASLLKMIRALRGARTGGLLLSLYQGEREF